MDMIKSDASILLVARPGRRRDSLRALLKAIPQLQVINQADDGPAALKLINGHQLALMLLDTSLSDDEVRLVLEQIKNKPSHPHCLVLADTSKRQKMAETGQADKVLSADFAITDFLMIAERLLSLYETPIEMSTTTS